MKRNLLENFLTPLALFLAAFALRILWGHQTHAPTLDTAVVGLMAMDIQEGARPLFFTGQGYMGALEAYLMAGTFELFGADRFTMTLVPSFFGALWPVLMYFLLKLDVPAKSAAAGALFVLFPAGHILWYTTVPYGGYPEMYFFGMAMLLHAAVRLKQKTHFPWKDAALLSLFAFLGAWTNLQVFPFLATAGMLWIFLLFPDLNKPSRWLPFALVPLALALAVIPQMILSAENPSSPPLFSSISAKQIAYSFKALLSHDLPALMSWQGLENWPRWIWLPAYLIFAVLGLFVAIRKPEKVSRRNLALCGIFLFFFSVLYFPHSMSGYVPRYVIAPFVLCTAVLISLSFSARTPLLKWIAGITFACWIILQISSFPDTLRLRHAKMQRKADEIEKVIEVSRQQNLTHLRFIGSGMEGHRAAAFTFEALKNPVFTSSYDERRRDADLAWHESTRAGYFFSEAYLPFVKGSLDAMGIHKYKLIPAGRFVVMPMPEVSLQKMAAMKQIKAPFSWQQGETSFRITFPTPVLLAGLRLTAPQDASLPYQYKITADGDKLLAVSKQRLGTSYLSGDRVYFKGYEDQMDVFWPTEKVSSLEFSFTPGPLNKQPVIFQNLYVFTENSQAAADLNLEALFTWLKTHPDALVVAADGVSSLLRRQGFPHDRLPLPWNPRDPEAQPLTFPLSAETQYLLLLENRFGTGDDFISFGSVKGIRLEKPGHWNRFTFD